MKNRSERLLAAFSLGVGLVFAVLWLLEGRVPARATAVTERRVCPSGCAYSSVQTAVDASADGDVIKVAAGTYTDIHQRAGITQVVYISKSVTIQGGYTTGNWATPDPEVSETTLDAQGRGRVVVIRQAGPTLAGFVISGGTGYYSGGGINAEFASPTIRDNLIMGNSASGDGGGVWVNGGSAQIRFNRITGNSAAWAGGLRIINDADVTIADNQVSENVASISGGGIDIDCCGSSTPLVARNLVLNNRGGTAGGGVRVKATNARLVNNLLIGNQADAGADVWMGGQAAYPAGATLLHNTLVGELAGGVGVWSAAHVSATLVNNIIVSHTVGITNTDSGSTVSADHTLFNGNGTDYGSGVSSTGEVHGDPAFVDPGTGNYHIGPTSTARDAGTAAGVNDDIDGDTRPQGSGYDIGADEFRGTWHIYLPLLAQGVERV